MSVTSPHTDPFASIRYWNSQRSEKQWWHSFELPDGTLIEGVCGLASLQDRIGPFPIPQDLQGKRVLDIGTWDGWFAFEMERRGAEVLAIDSWDTPLFHQMHARLGSRVEYRQIDMYKLTPETVGRFDIVLFMGVLYHLKHPLLALERVCALTTDMAVVDSFVLREEHLLGESVERRPVMEFYETNEMGGQTDNWVGPSLPCLMSLCRTAGFARVELRKVIQHSACIACYRRWDAPPHARRPGLNWWLSATTATMASTSIAAAMSTSPSGSTAMRAS
jgi:tRNA (mo5U34)-methyltransferase